MAARGAATGRLAALILALTAAAWPRVPAAAPPSVPALVSPWPSGLTGTLVFESDVAGRPGLYTLDLARGRVARLTGEPGYRDQTPRWAPDGRRVLFTSNRAHYSGTPPDTGTPDFDVWSVAADGGDARRLTHDPANEQDPAWGPDGMSVVYSSDRDGRGDLYAQRLDTGAVTRLTRHFVGRAIMPAPAPGPGRRIAFAAQSLRAGAFWSYQIHVLDASGATPALPSSVGGCWPRWSPDGSRLAHVRSGAGDTPSALEIRSGPALETSRVLAAGGLWAYYPSWSPDGTRLVFSVSPAHHEGEDWDLAVMDVVSGRWQRLTTGHGNDRLPDWTR
jgi:Tol biopolymer transport system component